MSDVPVSENIVQFRADFDEKSLGVLADILSTLYANPERSALREYIANGIDAHTLAGVSRAVHVKLPTHVDPSLVIRDFGDGMSLETMQETFFKYGASTKTDTDDAIGAFGIGAKSAFSLSKSWVVTNVHQGKKYVMSSTNDSYGAPLQSVIVNGDPTDDSSGITVTIPINPQHLGHDWRESASSLATWFPKGSVEFTPRVEVSHYTTRYKSYHRLVKNGHAWRESDFNIVMCGISYTTDTLTLNEIRTRCENEVRSILNLTDPVTAKPDFASSVQAASTSVKTGWTRSSPVEREIYSAEAHSKLVNQFLTMLYRSAVVVDAGDVELMPSRESIKGTPKTLKSVVARVVELVEAFTSEVADGRKLGYIERIALSKRLAAISETAPTVALDALGIPDVKTGVRHSTDYLSLHAVISRGEKNGVLVTGVPSESPLSRRRIVENKTGCSFLCTDTDGADPMFGDLSSLMAGREDVSGVLTRTEYRELASRVAPANRDKIVSVHRWCIVGHDPETWLDANVISDDPFTDVIEAVSEIELAVYISPDDVNHHTLQSFSASGIRAVIISKGRRKMETFERELGREVLHVSDLHQHAFASSLDRISTFLSGMSEHDRYCATLATNASRDYVKYVEAVLGSDYGNLIHETHRARTFVSDYEHGKSLIEDNRVLRSVKYALENPERIQIHADPSVAGMFLVNSSPWKLIEGKRDTSPETLREAAVYLAAIG